MLNFSALTVSSLKSSFRFPSARQALCLSFYMSLLCIGAIARADGSGTHQQLTTFTTLNSYLPVAVCDPKAPMSLFCAAAISRYCRASGYTGGGVGPAEYNGDQVIVTCLGSDAATQIPATFTKLQSLHPYCNSGDPFSSPCISAADNYCRSQGYGSGFGPVEANGDAAIVQCLNANFASPLDITYSELRKSGISCDSSNAKSPECNSTASRYCQSKGFASATPFQQVGLNDAIFSCLADFSKEGTSPYIPSGFDLVYSDEFNEAKLDTTKWWTRYINGGPPEGPMTGVTNFLNNGQERFGESNNHIMSGNSLKLTAYGTADQWEHPSGMVRSKKTFKYGYFELRMKAPSAIANFPAFWMVPDSLPNGNFGGWPPELDFVELFNQEHDPLSRTKMRTNIAAAGGGSFLYTDPNFVTYENGDPEPKYLAPFSFDQAFHVIGALWDTDDTLAIFVDGKMIMKRSFKWIRNDGSEPPFGHILLDLAVGGVVGRPTTDWNVDPQSFELDYFRAYQRTGQHKNGVSFVGQDLCPANGGC